MPVHSIAAMLGGALPPGRQVTVQGWVRTRRDSKAGLSFITLHPSPGKDQSVDRAKRLEVLDARLDELGMYKTAYTWYRDLRRYGSAPHAGFGLGFERTVSYVTGMTNIRDVIPFPRTPRSADF